MKFKKLSKSKKRKISQFNKKMGCLFFALLMMLSLATPAFAAVNVDGQGGTSSNVTGGGAYTYNVSDQMWKISIYYSRYDKINTEEEYQLWNDSFWKQYGKTFYMYHPTAVRGAGGKIRLNVFQSAVFMNGNKVEFLGQTSDVSKVNASVSFYSDNWFYSNSQSPAIAFNGYTIDPVKDFFKSGSNFVKLAQQAYLAAGYDNWISPFGNTTFSLDGFNGNYIDKTANGGKAQNGYVWSTGKHLTFNDWYKGVKKDYNGNQIYLHPKVSGDTVLNGTAWMVVYEPVVMAEVNPFTLGGNTYCQVACTPTEWAILAENGIIELKNYRKHMLCYVGNSTYLEKDWNGLSARGSEFPTDVSNSTVYQKGGIGMTIFNPYNYVLKDYKVDISAPVSVGVNVPFDITFIHSNLSQEWIGNTGKHEAPMNVKYVWLAMIKKDNVQYWFDLWNLRGKTLSTSTALKDSSGKLISSYADAAKIVEARRANQSNGLSPYNRNKHYYRGAKDSKGNPADRYIHTYSYTIASEFNGCNLDLRIATNVDSNGQYTNAKKELSSGAYYKSGENGNWGNNYIKNTTEASTGYVLSIGSVPSIEPVISVQLNNKTSNEDITLAGKRFAVWCIDSFSYQVLEVSGKHKIISTLDN